MTDIVDDDDDDDDDDDALPDLRDWGYAPGYYSICCADCQNVSITDKRAIRCFACALAISKEDGR